MGKLEIYLKYLLNNGTEISDDSIIIKSGNLKSFFYDMFEVFGHNILSEFKAYYFTFTNFNCKIYINNDGNVESIKHEEIVILEYITIKIIDL